MRIYLRNLGIRALPILMLSACSGSDSPNSPVVIPSPTSTISPTPSSTPTAQPNIKYNVVLIVADDLGFFDLGYNGSKFYETPNLDKLAKESVNFTSFYSASPVCSPTRASILTGRYPARIGMDTVIADVGNGKENTLLPPPNTEDLPLSEVTLAEVFRTAGYATMATGKWHLGRTAPFWPEAQGFSINVGGTALGNPNGLPGKSYLSPYRNPRIKDGPDGEFLERRLASETTKFIDFNKNRTFFIQHSFYAPHTPLMEVPEFSAIYKEKLSKLDPAPAKRALAFGAFSKTRQDNVLYGSMISALDSAVGEILDAIKLSGIEDRTVVVFTSDNGGFSAFDNGATSNEPLRGGKGWLYEGGIRVPLLIKAPNLPKGTSRSLPSMSIDLFPTILGLAGVGVDIEGIDGKDLFSNKDEARSLYWHYPVYNYAGWRPGGAVRSGDWKMIQFFENDEVQLYNLRTDPNETSDLSRSNSDIVARLKEELKVWQQKVGARMPRIR